MGGGGGVNLGMYVWVGMCRCVAVTLEPLAYTRASASEFCYPKLDKTPQIPTYPRVVAFQKLVLTLDH